MNISFFYYINIKVHSFFIISLLVYLLLNNCTIDVQEDDPRREMHPVVTAIFGATAGAASVFGNTPLDVVKTRMQVASVFTHLKTTYPIKSLVVAVKC